MPQIPPPDEIIKRDPEEFGGIQTAFLTREDLAARMCVARYCGDPGAMQVMAWDGHALQTVCIKHALYLSLLQAAILGDPSPMSEARDLAEREGVEWSEVLALEPIHPSTPQAFRCLHCGGRMAKELVGKPIPVRYWHTCAGGNNA